MDLTTFSLALLTDNPKTLQQVQYQLQLGDTSSHHSRISVTWVDLQRAVPEELSGYDGYLSDAPCAYLMEHQGFFRQHICFWLVESEVAQTEILAHGVTDCFLLSELCQNLLCHCLRLAQRRSTTAAEVHDGTAKKCLPLQGDRLESLIQNIPGAVYRCLHSAGWQPLFVSDAIETICGYPVADFLTPGDRPFARLIHPDDLQFVERTVAEHLQDHQPFSLEYRIIHRDGSIRWVEEQGQGVFDDAGNVLWLDGIIFAATGNSKRLTERLEQQQRSYYEKTPAMLHAINDQGEIVAVSDRWLAVMGYRRAEVLGRKSTDFLTPQSQQHAKEMLGVFFRQGHVEDVEYQFVTKSGEVRDVLMSATMDHSGKERRSLVVLVDVTHRNRVTAELNLYQNRLQILIQQRTKALAHSEARLRTLLAVAPLGIVEVNLQGCFQFVNDHFAQMLGTTPQELIGCPVVAVTHGEDQETTTRVLAQLVRGEVAQISLDKRYLCAQPSDRDWFWGHTKIACVKDAAGEPDYFIAVIENIHDRKLMEDSLRISESRLMNAQAIAKIGAWEWDAVADKTYWSAEAFRIFGHEPGSFSPDSNSFFEALHPDDREQIRQNLGAIATGKDDLKTSEYRIIRPDGQVRIIRDHHEVVRDESGQILFLSGAVQDITETQVMVAALEESQIRLTRAQAIAKLGIWEWDVTQDQIYWSQETYELYGQTPETFVPTFENYLQFVHPEDRDYIITAIDEVLNGTHIPSYFEYRIMRGDGSVRMVKDYHEVIRDETGEIVLLRGATQDVTAYHQAIAALEKSEARSKRAEEIAKLSVWEWDFLTQKSYWSDNTYNLFGIEHSIKPSFENFLAVVHPDDRPHILQLLTQVQETGELPEYSDFRIVTPDGTVKQVRDYYETIRNEVGEICLLRGVIQDVTDFKEMIATVEESKALLDKAQAIAKIGVWKWDLPTDELTWSKYFFQMFGFKPFSIKPNFDLFISMVHPEDQPRIFEALEFMQQGNNLYEFEYRIITNTGEEKILLEHIDVIQNEQGEPIQFCGTLRDITESRLATQALQESETRFRELVENIDESFWVNPANPTVVSYISPGYEKIWGRSCESLLENGDSWVESVHPDDRDRQIAALQKMAEGELFDEEYRIIRPDGEVRWVHARSSKIHAEDGTLLRHVGVVSDITDLKKVELDLRESEARFRGIFDQAALGIAQVSIDDRFMLVNQAFCELIGYSPEELQTMTWRDITHPEDVNIRASTSEYAVTEDRSNLVLTKRYLHKQGQAIWVKVIASFVLDDRGQPEYLLALVEDITAYKEAELQLAQIQRTYEDLVNGVYAILYEYSTIKGGLFYSPQVQEILGYSPEYLLENPHLWHDSIHPDDLPLVNQAIAELGAHQHFWVEYRIQDAQGRWHWLSDKSFSIEQRANDEWIVGGLALDITHGKESEENLRHRLKLETTLAEISNRMIAEPNLDLRDILAVLGETFQADRMSVMTQQGGDRPTCADCVQRLIAWAAREELELASDLFQEIDLSPYPWWVEHWRARHPILIHRHRPLPPTATQEQAFLDALKIKAVMWMPLQDHLGEHWGYIECSTTAENHLLWSKEDADLLAIAGDLIYNYTVRKQSRQQLEQAKERAEAANHAKSQFLENMSHELRTPLNAILGFAQIMQSSQSFPQEHREHLNILRSSGQRLLSLLNDILDLASFEGGKPKLQPKLFNLYALLDDLDYMFRPTVRQKALTFEIHRSDNLPRYITADQAKLHSVLIHLLSNAFKFTHRGTVQLSVRAIAEDPLTLRFSVSDTGIGIPTWEQTRLFDSFVKLDAGDQLGQGSGLGLALSQKFVTLMGGEIIVSSREHVGSCFMFDLLCVGEAIAPEAAISLAAATVARQEAMTPEQFRTLPAPWQEKFYLAACAARTKTLEQLIDELPPQTEAIADQLRRMVKALDFTGLIALSEPSSEGV